MVKVKDVYGDTPTVSFDIAEIAAPDPNDIWVKYDRETDSMTIYVTRHPVPGLHVYMDDDTYVIVDGESHPVGFYIEAWERRFVPAHPELRDAWAQISPSVPVEAGWSMLLRLLALWIVMLLGHGEDSDPPVPPIHHFQPA